MLNNIISFSLKYRFVVLIAASLLTCFGMYSLRDAKYDVFPEFAPAKVEIQTEAQGLSPEQVELLVTHPLEDALNGIPGVEFMRSASIQGLSVVTLTFKGNRDIYRDRQAVAERLSGVAPKFPHGIAAPLMAPLTSSTGDLMSIGVTSKTVSLIDLRTMIDWTLKPRLLSVPGVAKIGTFGGLIKQIQIRIKPKKLIEFDLSIEDVLAAAQKVAGIRGAGFIDTPTQRIIIQSDGQLPSAEELAKTAMIRPVGNTPVSAVLGDVADVVIGSEPPLSAATVMGEPGVVLNVWAQYGANTLETTVAVDKVLNDLIPVFEAQNIIINPYLFRADNFIHTSVNNIQRALLIGALLVIVVLFFFLYDISAAFISCLAIPISLLTATGILQYFGFSLNTMTLGGLAIALGEVVDDAVIDVENVIRRLKENYSKANPEAAIKVVFDASIEVRSAVVYATFAVILVFTPVLFVSGLAGRLFAPLGIAYISAILASLVVALTVTPALSLLLLGGRTKFHEEPVVLRFFKKCYQLILIRVERSPYIVWISVLVFLVYGVTLFSRLGTDFLPKFRENHLLAHITATAGASLPQSISIGNLATAELKKLPWVRYVAQRAGRAAVDDTFGPNSSELEIDLYSENPKAPPDAAEIVRELLQKIPGAEYEVNSFLEERIEETLTGFTAPVVIEVVGKDLEVIYSKAAEISSVLEKIKGAVDIKIDSPPGTPVLSIKLRPEALLQWGFEPVAVLDVIGTAFQGTQVGQIYDGNRIIGVSVLLAEPNDPLEKLESVKTLPIRNAAGTYVPLKDLAEISEGVGRYAIAHNHAERAQTVTCDVEGRDVASFLNDAKKAIAEKISLPADTFISFSGEAEAQAQAQFELLLHSGIAAIVILLLLSIVFGNLNNLIIVVVNLPMALVGGVLAAFLSEQTVSIGMLVGFVTLFGITLRNSIMMVSHFKHLVEFEGCDWNAETARRGASERLVPIVMTALVTALGLLPLALTSTAPGHEIEGPMAIVILGGLATSTVLNLLVLPSLALKFGRFRLDC